MKKNQKMRKGLRLGFCALAFAGCCALYAQTPAGMSTFDIPESAFCRRGLIESRFEQSPAIVKNLDSQVVQNEIGDYFLVRHEEANGELQIIVAPLVRKKTEAEELSTGFSLSAVKDKDGVAVLQRSNSTEKNRSKSASEAWTKTWPKDAPGSWILYRDASSGAPLRIRYYFVPDKEVYVEFFPGKDKCFADFIIYGAVAAGKVPLPVPFERLYAFSAEELYLLTRYTLPWNYTRIFVRSYGDVKEMTSLIRSMLPGFRNSERFKSKNASLDFLKWIADGLVKPLTGGIIAEESLEMNTVETEGQTADVKLKGLPRRIPDEKYGPLNYIRNIAAAVLSADTGVQYRYDTSGADVKTEAFSYYKDSSGVPRSGGFVANSGYPVEILKPLLYILGVTEARHFFFGAVRKSRPAEVPAGQLPERQVFAETAAFFPYFDSEGHFQVSVFENAHEYTLDEFIGKYRGCFVSLVRIKAAKEFYPDRFEERYPSEL